MRLTWWVGALVGAQVLVQGVSAQETNTLVIVQQLRQRIEELERKVQTLEHENKPPVADTNTVPRQRFEALDQQVKVLQREREADQEAAVARAKTAPRITLGERGFSFSSADTNFVVQLKGLLQIDSRTFFNDGGVVGNDTFLVRRARPILQGTVFHDFDFTFVPDFGGTSSPQLYDAYLNYRYSDALQFQIGKYKSPVGLEYLQSDAYTFFNERALPTALVPGRDVGFEVHGDLFGGVVGYAAGIFNGVGDARNSSNADFEDDKAFEGRVFFQPFKRTSLKLLQGAGFGLGGSYESEQGTNTLGLPATTGGTLAGYFSDGQQQFFAYNPSSGSVVADGEHWRLAPQGYYYYGPVALLGEYTFSDQRLTRTGTAPVTERLDNTAWQIAAGWVLTGEEAPYSGPVSPRHPFNPLNGNWGALQLVARYAELHIDDDAFPEFANPALSARSAQEWAVGLNWWLNRNVRVNTSFSHTTFNGGGGAGASAPAAITRKDENVLFTRVQLAF
jgi:phosphate-selective porin OprO and OprP